MEEIYPGIWTKRHGVVDSGIWKYTLGDLSWSQVKCAIGKIIRLETVHTEFPPNPMQFRKLCLEVLPKSAKQQMAEDQERREKLDEQKTKQLTQVCIATQKGWGYEHLSPYATYAAFQTGDLPYEKIKTDMEKFMAGHYYENKGSLAELI